MFIVCNGGAKWTPDIRGLDCETPKSIRALEALRPQTVTAPSDGHTLEKSGFWTATAHSKGLGARKRQHPDYACAVQTKLAPSNTVEPGGIGCDLSHAIPRARFRDAVPWAFAVRVRAGMSPSMFGCAGCSTVWLSRCAGLLSRSLLWRRLMRTGSCGRLSCRCVWHADRMAVPDQRLTLLAGPTDLLRMDAASVPTYAVSHTRHLT